MSSSYDRNGRFQHLDQRSWRKFELSLQVNYMYRYCPLVDKNGTESSISIFFYKSVRVFCVFPWDHRIFKSPAFFVCFLTGASLSGWRWGRCVRSATCPSCSSPSRQAAPTPQCQYSSRCLGSRTWCSRLSSTHPTPPRRHSSSCTGTL